jgi:hypothetical protein
MVKGLLAVIAFLTLLSFTLWLGQGDDPRAVQGGEEWYLINLHQHIWDGEEWGRHRVDYRTVFDLMFNGSYVEYDGVLINDEPPNEGEKAIFSRYVEEKYPGKLYLVGAHYHVPWRGGGLAISLALPSSKSSSLPKEYYNCVEIRIFDLETIARDVHSIGGLLIWDHPYRNLDSYSKDEIETLMELFDGIELASVRGLRGAGTLTKEELDNYWEIIEPYVLEGKVFPAGVTDYSAYLGMPEKRGAFWLNKDYGTLVRADSKEEGAVLAALREKRTVVVLRQENGELLLYGRPEFVAEVRELYSGTLR